MRCPRSFASILRVRWRVALLVVICWTLVGCSGDPEDPIEDPDVGIDAGADADVGDDVGPRPGCEFDADCEDGEVCWNDECWSACDADDDCTDEQRCFEDRCMPRDCQGVDCGADQSCWEGGCYPSCQDDTECSRELMCLGGACADPCETAGCGDDQTCYRGGCFDVCDQPDDCADDETCHDGRCAPVDCDGVDCREDETCYRGVCNLACDADDDCEASGASCVQGACIDEWCEGVQCGQGQTCYRGDCRQTCDDDAECGDQARCSSRGHCAPLDCEGVDCTAGETCWQGICYRACQADADCEGAARCRDQACVDACEDVDCPTDQACYRGDCRPGCDDHDDCGADERCSDDHCAPLDCEGVDCNDDETCVGGICYPECSDADDCSGLAVCWDDQACIVPDCEQGTPAGTTSCPALLDNDVDVTDVTDTEATFTGELTDPPVTILDHGFCWSTEPDPAGDDDNCESLSAPGQRGEFSLDVDGLDPRTDYYAQAYVDTTQDRHTSFFTPFRTLAAPPADVTTTTSFEAVTISWSGVDDADHYRVVRDPGTTDETVVDTTSSTQLVDQDADPGDVQAPEPGNFDVDDGTDAVHLEWTPPDIQEGTEHEYVVVAVFDDGLETPPSAPAYGARSAADIDYYSIEIGDDGWTDVGDTTSWDHETGPDADIDTQPADPEAGTAEHVDHVPLTADQAQGDDGPATDYRVRAVTTDLDGDIVQGQATDSESGRRLLGQLTHQWEFDDGDGFEPVGDCTADQLDCDDTAGQPQPQARSYRLAVSAEGADEPAYAPDETGLEGWIAVEGTVQTNQPSDIEPDRARLQGYIHDLGDPDPAEVGLCWDEDPADSPSVGDAEQCLQVDPVPDEVGGFDRVAENLDPDTTYWVRAFLLTDAGGADYVYGDARDFTTAPPAPECEATDEPFGGGSGTDDDPYTICSADHLDAIGDETGDLDSYFLVMDDLEMAGTSGFEPIGDDTDRFTGHFDGDGHTIENLEISSSTDDVGLFGVVGDSGDVQHLELVGADVDGDRHVGTLVGTNYGSVENCETSGRAESLHTSVGGAVGTNHGTVMATSADVEVTAETSRRAGGLVGLNRSNIFDSVAHGDVQADGTAGGLVGAHWDGVLIDSRATGDVTNRGDSNYVGGLVGESESTVDGSFAAGDVEGEDGSYVGGLIGLNAGSTVDHSYATGDVETSGNYVGGLIGSTTGDVSNSYSAGAVSGATNTECLIGSNSATVESSYYDSTQCNEGDSQGGDPVATDDFDDESTFPDWDFEFTWTIGTAPDNEQRPIFQWQD